MQFRRAAIAAAALAWGCGAVVLRQGGEKAPYKEVGDGAYVDGEAVAQRTHDNKGDCEKSKSYLTSKWDDCYKQDFMDGSAGGKAPKTVEQRRGMAVEDR
eukprot:TRINITY_DN7653_c0_g1_i2.p2 TRINITY_DN7653_c0_g1~~TRINITY_DN7653_c0_g1_i2.p2  ORF type:complete len:100 (-),score=43.16 TRINITY_DN7653_c0_g1_i2:148-447(-)